MRGHTSLSLLPPWHIYERTVSYYLLSQGARQVYSSVKRLKGDLTKFTPNYLVCVPLVLDTLHARVMGSLATKGGFLGALAQWLVARAQEHTQARSAAESAAIAPAEFARFRAR